MNSLGCSNENRWKSLEDAYSLLIAVARMGALSLACWNHSASLLLWHNGHVFWDPHAGKCGPDEINFYPTMMRATSPIVNLVHSGIKLVLGAPKHLLGSGRDYSTLTVLGDPC